MTVFWNASRSLGRHHCAWGQLSARLTDEPPHGCVAAREIRPKPTKTLAQVVQYFQRQIRVAPLHTENTGWFLRNVGRDVLRFNTDYPNPEGGKDPFGTYERSLDAVNASPKELDNS